MPTRRRLLAVLGGAALVIGAVVVLRATDDGPTAEPPPETGTVTPPVRINRFAADNVVLPDPGARPDAPATVAAFPTGAGRLRLAWADGLPGGAAPAGAVGYDVRWQRDGEDAHTRLVVAPGTQLDGLVDGQSYRIEIRAVDGYGQRSSPTTTTGVPGRGDPAWRGGLTGLFDDFSSPDSVLADASGSHWHVSGYRGCVDLGPGAADGRGLPIDLGCGADMAVLRARAPLRLAEPPGPDGVLGRVAVLTDTAGPGGELTVDLVPGPADRVGAGRTQQDAGPDLTVPAGTVRVAVNDSGALIRSAADVPAVTPPPAVTPAPRRGPGVLHLFEVTITTSGVRVAQDGVPVAVGGVLPQWRQASVLLGFRGPDGQRSRVHVAAAGFTGEPSPVSPVVEAGVNPATRQVLGPDEPAPNIGIARTPLASASSARLVATMTTAPGVDANGVVVQLGDHRIPARLAAAGPPSAPGSAVTLIADIPAELIGDQGPDTLAPFVLRAPSGGGGASVVESYLEIAPGPDWRPREPTRGPPDARRPARDAPPKVEVTLGDAAGAPLGNSTVAPRGQLVLTATLDASATQWDTGAVAGVQGIELWLDGRIVAGVPTATDGPGVGGRYALSIALGGLGREPHVFELRAYGPDGAVAPVSVLRNFVVE